MQLPLIPYSSGSFHLHEIVIDWEMAKTSGNNATDYSGANGRAKMQPAIDDRIGDRPITVYVPAAGAG
jgi:hypothetical protein